MKANVLTRLSDRDAFQTINGLWKGKKGQFTRAVVIRNTNFTTDGILDLSDVAELDVEAKQLATRVLEPGDIIIERSGGGPKQAVGRVCYFDSVGPLPYSFSNFTSVIRTLDRKSWSTRYVHYFLMHLYRTGFTEGLQHATTGIRNLDFSTYLDVEIPRWSKAEQEKIAAMLWKVQQAIQTQDALLRATRDLKAAAMQHLFTNGFRGKVIKRTEIGDMPASWDVVTIGAVALIASGGTPERAESANWLNGSIPWVKTGEVNYCVIEETEEKITLAGLRNSAARIFPKGTLLMAMYGQGITRGKVAMLGIDAATNQACAAIISDGNKVRTDFLFQVLTYGYERLRGLAHGGQQQNLNADLIRGYALGLPKNLDEQRDIASTLATIDRKFAHHQKNRNALNDLFQSLLHQLMTAQIRVADLDIDTGCVAELAQEGTSE